VLQSVAECCSVLQSVALSSHGVPCLVGSLRLQFSFAEYSPFYRALSQKKATPSVALSSHGVPSLVHGDAIEKEM